MKRHLAVAAIAALAIPAALSGCSSLSAGSDPGASADFPGSEPITLVMPFSAGGSTDLMLRGLVPFLEEELGTSVIVENTVGAGGQVALTAIAGAAPDGHTIGVTNLPSTLAYVNEDRQATYEQASFEPLATVNRFRGIIATSASGEWSTLEQVVEAAQAEPGSITVGVDGLGGDDHIFVTAFEEAADVEFTVVPFDDGSEKMTALIGNQIDLSFGSVPTFMAQIDSGNAVALAALDAEPIVGLEDVPTTSSFGYDVQWESYNVLSVPAGTAPEVRTVLEDAIEAASAAAAADADFTTQMENGGYEFGFQDSAWTVERWTELDARWRELVPIAISGE
ncbi:tripartite tricarboxylate transporter substrate binding protein [Agrococcus sp. ARC_14]|uniref:Bug family tripartite tricarboxylate transporter substrate binding protein n=1 Tax=Agrococcus sp. ARC_14 TaxID=2919927 RepID=UPI001F0614A8|nr:tripartite tricarboxylate transporter substrate binding protein [Agrococcus sp. ARC_14]MCH1881901.1 tripartite tricarboxylate transporter substrate binding protein [Agrococcus sp. ARC_14]